MSAFEKTPARHVVSTAESDRRVPPCSFLRADAPIIADKDPGPQLTSGTSHPAYKSRQPPHRLISWRHVHQPGEPFSIVHLFFHMTVFGSITGNFWQSSRAVNLRGRQFAKTDVGKTEHKEQFTFAVHRAVNTRSM